MAGLLTIGSVQLWRSGADRIFIQDTESLSEGEFPLDRVRQIVERFASKSAGDEQ